MKAQLPQNQIYVSHSTSSTRMEMERLATTTSTHFTVSSRAETSDEDVIGPMISLADSNKDGYIEYDEFEKVLNGGKGKNMRLICVMEDAFRVMDKDGDGKVGYEDLKSYLNWAGFEAHDEDVKAMIRLGCGDENGGVTFEGLLKVLPL
ncbi:hypothetical protein BUALT_Bualt12G0111300 [Buddleja alternifolia]|uniref:EF-hand domain-containing protein n=1 Tax=Buddleja alternifolia TaxID=168488 RepID=A0AAV6WRY3_9LAMI|nr:hypothetical protein BUALT_Bualt12G0111300 [Buddleja alternifolia]